MEKRGKIVKSWEILEKTWGTLGELVKEISDFGKRVEICWENFED